MKLTAAEIKQLRPLSRVARELTEIAPYMSAGMISSLFYIAITPNCTMQEMAKALGYSQPTISRYIHDPGDMGRMKNASKRAKGLRLVSISGNSHNLREKLVELSPAGVSFMNGLCKHLP